MVLYVVVRKHRDGTIEDGVFSTREKAEKIIENTISESHWFDMSVIGDQDEPGFVFSASIYDQLSDEHYFDKIFGSYKFAKEFYKEKVLILRREIDERLKNL